MSRVVIAPDSFKGTASADAAARAIAEGWARVRPGDDLVLLPLADGGEGTVDAVAAAVPGSKRVPVRVTGPDDEMVDAEWLLLPDGTGVVELANTSGLPLLGRLLRPLDAHTRGFGQAVRAALDAGVSRLVLAIGGSSSTDGGAGVLAELGARFLDAEGSPIADGNRGLHDLAVAELSGLRTLPRGGVTVLCDVTNPLLGERGSARVFGPQKGATEGVVDELEGGLSSLAAALPAVPADLPGVGAAGGVGFGLVAWGGMLVSGSHEIAALSGLDEAIAAADVVVTGEGGFDEQSAGGKVVSRVLSAAREASTVPMLVAGRIAAPTDAFAAAVSLTDLAGSPERSLAHPLVYAERAGAVLAADFGRRG